MLPVLMQEVFQCRLFHHSTEHQHQQIGVDLGICYNHSLLSFLFIRLMYMTFLVSGIDAG